jgi:hypothetical protein
MSKKIFGSWYNLPEDLKHKLETISPMFFEMRDRGSWAPGKEGGYEKDALVVMRTHFISYDLTMPCIRKIMNQNIRVAIHARNIKSMDVVFYS